MQLIDKFLALSFKKRVAVGALSALWLFLLVVAPGIAILIFFGGVIIWSATTLIDP